MRYIVEVPVYLKLEIDAADAGEAVKIATNYATAGVLIQEDEGGHILLAEVVPLDETEDDREPDVYVCRGGKLNQLGPGDLILPLDEDC